MPRSFRKQQSLGDHSGLGARKSERASREWLYIVCGRTGGLGSDDTRAGRTGRAGSDGGRTGGNGVGLERTGSNCGGNGVGLGGTGSD